MITTPLCQLLGIAAPIFNASMSDTATGALAAAVSEAGGFGMIGGSSAGGAAWLRAQIAAARARTTRPFGVGFISSYPDTAELTAVALAEGVAAINHSFADPAPYVAPAHAAGVRVFAQVQTLAGALRAAESGVDVIIAQGSEAGGHGGSIGTFALLPAIVDAVAPLPVVAAGGIADGRGVAAALLLGAQGVWLGTRFAASPEWGGQPWKQQAILAATADDTMQTGIYDYLLGRPFPAGIHDRVVQNAFNAPWPGRLPPAAAAADALREALLQGRQRGDAAVAGVSAGVSSGLITELQPAGEIVTTLVREAEALLRERPGRLLGE